MSSCTARTPSAGENPTIADPELTPADRAAVLGLARATLEARLEDRPLPAAGGVPGAALKRGAFVTLTERGALRGCIGHIAADRELGAVVQEMAVAAALDDPRFAPVTREELGSLALEISVLSEPTPLPAPVDAMRVVVGRDGKFYAPQLFTNPNWIYGEDPEGDVVKIPFNSPSPHAFLAGGALSFTGGVAVGPNGAVYVADGTAFVAPGEGRIVRLSP